MKNTDYLVSVAAGQTLEVWSVTAEMLLRSVPASNYEVIVPANDVKSFREITPSDITVSSESDFVKDFSAPLRDRLGQHHQRFGWYLQQLIKLEAVKRHSHLHKLVIWDADTVPLGPLTLFSSEGKPLFYRGKENHTPYFDSIRALFGLDKVVVFSFVAQCMPLAGDWAAQFFTDLEERHHAPWWQAIIDSIDPNEASGFSEYETLGTFFNDRFGPLQLQPTGVWSRRGYHYVPSALDLLTPTTMSQLPEQFDFLAFEDWNRPKEKKSKKRERGLRTRFRLS